MTPQERTIREACATQRELPTRPLWVAVDTDQIEGLPDHKKHNPETYLLFQHVFHDFFCRDVHFEVTLEFSRVKFPLRIPFSAVKFADFDRQPNGHDRIDFSEFLEA